MKSWNSSHSIKDKGLGKNAVFEHVNFKKHTAFSFGLFYYTSYENVKKCILNHINSLSCLILKLLQFVILTTRTKLYFAS